MAAQDPERFEMVGATRLRELHGQIPFLLLCATDVERKGIIGQLGGLEGERPLKGRIEAQTYYVGSLGRYRVVVTMCGMGSISRDGSLNTVNDAVGAWAPKAIIMVGIAFGRGPEKQALGDVLVSTHIISYEPERKGESPQSRGPIVESGRTLLNRFKNIDGWSFPLGGGRTSECHAGPILSGEKLVDDASFKQELFKRYPTSIGGEMEGAGVYAASLAKGLTEWIIVKGICDWADGTKDKRHQSIAVAAAMSLVKHVLSDPYAFESWQEAPTSQKPSDPRASNKDHPKSVVLLGDEFFQVEKVKKSGDGGVVITIQSDSSAIDAAMQELKDGFSSFRRGSPRTLAYANEVALVEVKSVENTLRENRLQWRLELQSVPIGNSTEYAVNTGGVSYSADDQAEMRARWILLNDKPQEASGYGRHNLLDLKGGPVAAVGSPLPDLYRQVGDESQFLVRGRLRCLAALRLSSTVETITKLELGPIRDGKVNVDFEGRRRRQYENRPATVLRVCGACSLSNP